MTAYRTCTERDIPALKSLWLSCFEECEDAADLFFQHNRSLCHAYACETDGRLISALYLIDCTLNGDRAHYLCGAATLSAYRGQGHMSALIEYALQDAKQRGDRCSLLMPASDSLYGFYARFGYRPSCAIKSTILSTNSDREIHSGSPDLTKLQAECCKENFLLWNESFIRFAALYYGCYGSETVQSENAFAVFQRDGDFADVYYAVYDSIEGLQALLAAEKIKRFRLNGAADCPLFEGGITKPFGMILPLHGHRAAENVYIGITLQ